MSARRTLFRLSALPLVAGGVVCLLAVLTLLEMREASTKTLDGEAPRLRPREKEPLSSRALVSTLPPERALAETEALLSSGPDLAMVEELWARPALRGELECFLLDSRVNPSVRIWLLMAFERGSPQKALDGAREILREGEGDVTLRLASYDVLSREGEARDLELLSPRLGETREELRVRERAKAALEARALLESEPPENRHERS